MVLRLRPLNLVKPILRLVVVISVIFSVGFLYAGGFDSKLLPGFIIIICIPLVPCTYLFIEYYIATRKLEVSITEDSITVQRGDSYHIHYLTKDLDVLKLYKSKGMEKGNFPFQTAEMFYHTKIIAKDGTIIVLTSFLGPNFDEALDMLKDVRKETFRTVYSTIYI